MKDAGGLDQGFLDHPQFARQIGDIKNITAALRGACKVGQNVWRDFDGLIRT